MASVMTIQEQMYQKAFQNNIKGVIAHLAKEGALKISVEEAAGLFNISVKKARVSQKPGGRPVRDPSKMMSQVGVGYLVGY